MDKKLSLTEEKMPLAELQLDIRQFDIPNMFRVDFSTAKESKKYANIDGENKKTDETASFTVQAKDEGVVSALEKMKLSTTSIQKIDIELVGDFDKVRALIKQTREFVIKLINPRVLLSQEVVNKRIVGENEWARVYAWNSVKLVADGLELQADDD